MTIPSRNTYALPAEWAPQSGIQLTWPHAATDWHPYLAEITQTFLEMARAITQYEQLLVVSPDKDATSRQLAAALSGECLRRVTVVQADTNDTWARDHAPLTLKADGQGGEAAPRLLDFRFNGWGEKFSWQKDNAISSEVHRQGALRGMLEDHQDLVLEGGAIESDGQGTVMTTSQCLLAPHRNQPLTRTQIEEQLCARLRARRVVWIDHGHLEGDDTDGHIDTLVRMAPADTLLYVACDDPTDSHYADLAAMKRQLQTFTTLDGRPYKLLPLPLPAAIYDGPDRLPATYANFVVLNGAVLVPTYRQPDADRSAMHTIGQAFPGRRIIGIDATTAIRQHGSLHCLTMQYPEGVIAPAAGIAPATHP